MAIRAAGLGRPVLVIVDADPGGRLTLGLTLYAVTSKNSGYGSFGDHYPHRDRHRSEAGPPAAIGQGGLVAAQFVASKTPPCTRMSPGRATALWMF
jgi:hypothetical protein